MTSKEEEKEKTKVNDNVQVVCRFRPLNQKEIELKETGCVIFYDEQTVGLKSMPELKFTLDHIFDLNSTQEQVYKIAALPVVKSVLEGFNGTILAYGQTSSGKTFTMSGLDITDRKLKGIIPRMIDQVFYEIYNHPEDMEFRLKVSIMEIYMEKIQDLIDINKHDLKIREDKNSGIYIQDLTEIDVDEDTVYDYYELAMQNRHIASTGMNAVSSRSHSLFSLTITQKNLKSLSVKTGKLFLVDLAGSEKLSKTGAQGQTMEEGKKINQSLSCLGNVINALTDNSSFIPYSFTLTFY